MNQAAIILFDGDCNFCCGWVQFLIRRDPKMKFRFALLKSEYGMKLLNSVDTGNRSVDSIVYLKRNQYFQESSAVLEILHDIGGIWSTFIVLKLIPKPIRDTLYRSIAKRRYAIFGTRRSCYLPSFENRKRFLSTNG